MRAGNLCCRCVNLLPQADENARDRAALLVDRLEDTRRDDAVAIDDERAVERVAVQLVLWVDRRVEDTVALDRRRARVRQQRKGNTAASRKVGQDVHRVVADGRNAQAGLANLGKASLQLHELTFAIRSPIGLAEEHQHSAFGPSSDFSDRISPCWSGRLKSGIVAPTFGPSASRSTVAVAAGWA